MQNQAAQQVVEALKKANNVMVTVTSSPSVDELTAAVGLTLILNHMNKHATTVFSGQIPSTIEFLQPEMAIETNTDSLRDFIISLDKSKADKLRYKVEDNVVRIFITPYKTSISQHDLEFSQGDYNVDVVIALGVVSREDFDQAVNTHGRILHDATIIGVTNQNVVSQIGAVNWNDPQASSISEMISGITDRLGPNVLDGQIATALMTGIVSETDRFRNSKTTPKVLSLSSKLMTAGANQQLIADKLEEKLDVQAPSSEINNADSSDGMLEIGHEEGEELQDIQIDDHGNINNAPSQSGLNLQTAPSFQNSSNQSQVQPQSQTQVPQPMPISQANEPPVSEVPAHQYISEPATTPAEDVSGDVDIAAAPQNDLPGVKNLEQRPSPTSDYDQLVEHGHKVIEPIKDDTLAPDPLATSILAEQNNTSVKPVTAADDVELPPPTKKCKQQVYLLKMIHRLLKI